MSRYQSLSSVAVAAAVSMIVGWQPASAETSVKDAIAAVTGATGPTDHWYGPTSGPPVKSGQSVVCIEYQAQDITAATWCKGTTEGAAKLGWKTTTIDGQGSADGTRRALQQAIALNPNGIVLAAVDAQSNVGLLKDATDAGIKVIGIHSVAQPGPAPDVHLFTNITYDPIAQATLAATFAIADSNGKAEMVVVTDTKYAIARAKADAAQAAIQACSTCKMLDYASTPAESVNQNMPGLFTSWIQKYADPFYVYSVSDADFFDPGVPALRTGGVPPTGRIMLIGSDGSPAAYERIKNGQYQLGTIPEPASLQGWQAIDELNRALNGAAPSGFVQPLHVITKDNVAHDITADGIYEPAVDYRAEYAKIWAVN